MTRVAVRRGGRPGGAAGGGADSQNSKILTACLRCLVNPPLRSNRHTSSAMSDWQFPGTPLPSFSSEDENTLELCRELFSSLGLSVSNELLATVRQSVQCSIECIPCMLMPALFPAILNPTVLLDDPKADTCIRPARPAPIDAGRRCAIGPVHPACRQCLVDGFDPGAEGANCAAKCCLGHCAAAGTIFTQNLGACIVSSRSFKVFCPTSPQFETFCAPVVCASRAAARCARDQ